LERNAFTESVIYKNLIFLIYNLLRLYHSQVLAQNQPNPGKSKDVFIPREPNGSLGDISPLEISKEKSLMGQLPI